MAGLGDLVPCQVHVVPRELNCGCMPLRWRQWAVITLGLAVAQAQVGPVNPATGAAKTRLQAEEGEILRQLPMSFGFWGVVQSLEPTAVVEPLDFGGLNERASSGHN